MSPTADDALPQTPLAGHHTQNVCFIGAGYVGALTGIIMAVKNPAVQVDVVDRNPSLIAAWNSDRLPISEPGLESLLFKASCEEAGSEASATNGINHSVCINGSSVSLDQERNQTQYRLPNISFSTDVQEMIKRADVIFLCVDTPLLEALDDEASTLDIKNLEAISKTIAEVSTNYKIVVEKSTAPCGMAERIQKILTNNAKPSASFTVLSNPEFLAQGNAISYLLNPSRVIIGELPGGSGLDAVAVLTKLYTPWVARSRIMTTDAWSSELSKLASNAFVAQRISSINSLSAICEATDADVDEVSRAIGMDPRIGPLALKAGLGFGGSCLQKDVSCLVYLAQRLGLPEVADYWKSVIRLNNYQRARVPQRIIAHLGYDPRGKKITVLGFSFKKNTNDTRKTTAISMVWSFLRAGLDVSIYDPHVLNEQISRELKPRDNSHGYSGTVTLADDLETACGGSSAIIIHTDWDEFGRDGPVNWLNVAQSMRSPKLFINAPGVIDVLEMEKYGFNVLHVGKRHRNDQPDIARSEQYEFN